MELNFSWISETALSFLFFMTGAKASVQGDKEARAAGTRRGWAREMWGKHPTRGEIASFLIYN